MTIIPIPYQAGVKRWTATLKGLNSNNLTCKKCGSNELNVQFQIRQTQLFWMNAEPPHIEAMNAECSKCGKVYLLPQNTLRQLVEIYNKHADKPAELMYEVRKKSADAYGEKLED